ncbi:hypothetical protein [Cytobacillus praedii]|uniref:hypothetical protein n=1 Tax=Cytobacillus praedii TaxID=1742358 RepID=UPI002E1CCB5F|nr:hypothetical protein [Cytobacillus praedii]
MIDWLEEVKNLQKDLKELESWMESVDWNALPKGVKNAIARGQIISEERIETYKGFAQKRSIRAV